MQKTFFIQSLDRYSAGKLYADISLSDYNFAKLKKIKGLSKLRWATLINGVLEPGKGTGMLEIGQHIFTVTYAWGGRDKPNPKSWNDRTSYTTRISTAENDGHCLEEIINQIIIDESGALTRTVPFRKLYKDISSPIVFRERLEENNAETLRLKKQYKNTRGWLNVHAFSKEQIAQAVDRFTESWNDPGATVEVINFMKNIETDMLR